jgi:translation initiation factor IF-2
MVPTAALATMMQTPRPPCSAPHRPAPGDRRGLRGPRTSSGPVACRVLAGWGSSGWAGIRRVGGPSAAARPVAPRPFGPVAPRPFGPPPRGPFGPLAPRPPGARPSQPASRPRGPGSRGSGTPRPASRRAPPLALSPGGPIPPGPPRAGMTRLSWPPAAAGPRPPAGLAPGGILGGTAPGGRPGTRPGVGGGPGTRPRGLAPGSPLSGLFGRVSRHRGSLIGASDVSRCGLVTGTRR